MRWFDRVLQRWRARVARPWLRPGDRVLDVGCHQGEFLDSLGASIGPSVGLDPLATPRETQRYRLLAEPLAPPTKFPDGCFDAIVMLATLEHVAHPEILGAECYRLLAPAGRVIITVPAPTVDRLLPILVQLRLVDGMSLEEHHGYDPRTTPQLFAPPQFTLERWRRFQLGLNHLFVFRRAE